MALRPVPPTRFSQASLKKPSPDPSKSMLLVAFGQLGSSWRGVGTSWGDLVMSWDGLGTSSYVLFGQLGAKMEPRWRQHGPTQSLGRHLEANWGAILLMFRSLGSDLCLNG